MERFSVEHSTDPSVSLFRFRPFAFRFIFAPLASISSPPLVAAVRRRFLDLRRMTPLPTNHPGELLDARTIVQALSRWSRFASFADLLRDREVRSCPLRGDLRQVRDAQHLKVSPSVRSFPPTTPLLARRYPRRLRRTRGSYRRAGDHERLQREHDARQFPAGQRLSPGASCLPRRSSTDTIRRGRFPVAPRAPATSPRSNRISIRVRSMASSAC